MIDTLAFLKEHFRDADGVTGLLDKHGFEVPERETAKKWFARASLPWGWGVALIIVAGKEAGAPVDLSAYRMGGQAHDIFE